MDNRNLSHGEKLIALGCVICYRGWLRELADKRESIIHGSTKPAGAPAKGSVGHPAESKACRLAELEDSTMARMVRAVDQAWLKLDEPALRDGIEDNIVGRVAYEYLCVPCGRRKFYASRFRLLRLITKILFES